MENMMTVGTDGTDTSAVPSPVVVIDLPAGATVHLGRTRGGKLVDGGTMYFNIAHTPRKAVTGLNSQDEALALARERDWIVWPTGILSADAERKRGKRTRTSAPAPASYPMFPGGWVPPASVVSALVSEDTSADVVPADGPSVDNLIPERSDVLPERPVEVAAASDGRTPDLSLGNRKPGRKPSSNPRAAANRMVQGRAKRIAAEAAEA